jgi:hypothetical protein
VLAEWHKILCAPGVLFPAGSVLQSNKLFDGGHAIGVANAFSLVLIAVCKSVIANFAVSCATKSASEVALFTLAIVRAPPPLLFDSINIMLLCVLIILILTTNNPGARLTPTQNAESQTDQTRRVGLANNDEEVSCMAVHECLYLMYLLTPAHLTVSLPNYSEEHNNELVPL